MIYLFQMSKVFEYERRYYCFSKEPGVQELLYMGTSLEEAQKHHGTFNLNIISLSHFTVSSTMEQ